MNSIHVLSNLKVVGVSLVKDGANMRRFSVTKKREIKKMLETSEKLLSIINEPVDGEPSVEGVSDVARDALLAMYRMFSALSSEIPGPAIKQLLAAFYTFDDEKEEVEVEMEKSSDVMPAEIQKKFDAISKRAEELEAILVRKELIEKAKTEYSSLPTSAEDIAEMFYQLRGSVELRNKIEKMLAVHAQVIKQSAAFSATGTAAPLPTDPLSKLNAIAAEIQKSTKGMSRSDAIKEAARQNPEIYAQYDAQKDAV